MYARPLYDPDSNELVRAIGPAPDTDTLREMFAARSSYARTLRAGAATTTAGIPAGKLKVPAQYPA